MDRAVCAALLLAWWSGVPCRKGLLCEHLVVGEVICCVRAVLPPGQGIVAAAAGAAHRDCCCLTAVAGIGDPGRVAAWAAPAVAGRPVVELLL